MDGGGRSSIRPLFEAKLIQAKVIQVKLIQVNTTRYAMPQHSYESTDEEEDQSMSRSAWIRIALAVVLALVVLFIVRRAWGEVPATASGDGTSGYRLASAWCAECHAIEPSAVSIGKPAPPFVEIANLSSTTELALKVFLQTNHRSMPNFILKPGDTDDLVAYILSLKRN